MPRTDAVLVTLTPKSKGQLVDNPDMYLFRDLLEQRDKKLGNALREALIRWTKVHGRTLTKREAKRLMAKANLDLLDAHFDNLSNTNLRELVSVLRQLAADCVGEMPGSTQL